MRTLFAFILCFPALLHAERFSVAYYSDTHVGLACLTSNLAASVDFILANTNDGDWNFKGAVNTGDCYEQNVTNWTSPETFCTLEQLTNGFNTLVSNGLFVIPIPGNHDADISTAPGVSGGWAASAILSQYWTNIFPVSWFSNQMEFVEGYTYRTEFEPNDSRQICATYEYGGVKLVLVNYHATFTNAGTYETLSAQFEPMTIWVTNQLAQYPDHNGIVLTHYMLNYDWGGNRPNRQFTRFDPYDGSNFASYTNLGPSTVCWEQGLGYSSNLLAVLSGHNRGLKKGHLVRAKESGGFVDVQCFNLQNQVSGGLLNLEAISVLTFDTVRKTVLSRTVNVHTGATIPNGSTEIRRTIGAGITNVFQHEWTMPLAVPKQKRLFKL